MKATSVTEEKINLIFSSLNQSHLPGAAVGISLGGQPVYRKAFGLAHIELPILLSPSMRMRIYSTTKQFTCLAYLLLCEEGKASINDTVGQHLPELHPVTHRVTAAQLMANTAGLRDPHDLVWQFSGTGRPVSSDDLLSIYKVASDVNFAPGTNWCYGNGNFLLLTAIIERITGQPLEDVLRARIFEPIGMHDTLLRRVDTDFVPNSATMHMIRKGGTVGSEPGPADFDRSYVGTALAGEAGMVSTVDDMLRWMAHMRSPHVGNKATWDLMKTPQRLNNGTSTGDGAGLVNGTSTGYGCGLMIGHYRGVEILHHAGGGQGANSQMLMVPSAGLDIVVLVNRHDVSAATLTNQILDACLPTLDASPISRNSGLLAARRLRASYEFSKQTFESKTTHRIVQLKTSTGNEPWIKDGAPIVVFDGFDIPVHPDETGSLTPTELLSYMNLRVDLQGPPGDPSSIRLEEFGNIDMLTRLDSPKDNGAEPLIGEFEAAAIGARLKIANTEQGARMHTTGRFGSAEFTLERLAEHIWRARSTTPMSWGGLLVLSNGGKRLHFTSLRTRALPFDRVA